QFRAILQVAPDDASALVGLAGALRGQADAKGGAKLEEARTTLEKVLDRDPHNVAALFNMGVLVNDFLKKPAEAKPYFQRFLDDAPSGHPSRIDAERYAKQADTAAGSATPPAAKSPPPAAPKGGKP